MTHSSSSGAPREAVVSARERDIGDGIVADEDADLALLDEARAEALPDDDLPDDDLPGEDGPGEDEPDDDDKPGDRRRDDDKPVAGAAM